MRRVVLALLGMLALGVAEVALSVRDFSRPHQPNATSCCPLLRTADFARLVASCLGWPSQICGDLHHDRFYALGSEDVLRCLEFSTLLTNGF